MEWSRPTQQGEIPNPRAGHAGVTVGENWFIVGGGDNKSGTDLYHFTIDLPITFFLGICHLYCILDLHVKLVLLKNYIHLCEIYSL